VIVGLSGAADHAVEGDFVAVVELLVAADGLMVDGEAGGGEEGAQDGEHVGKEIAEDAAGGGSGLEVQGNFVAPGHQGFSAGKLHADTHALLYERCEETGEFCGLEGGIQGGLLREARG
jgi:hypothetical protein